MPETALTNDSERELLIKILNNQAAGGGGGGGAPDAHAASHQDAGSDEVDVKLLGGFPGGTTDYLRADGTFATPPGGGGSGDVVGPASSVDEQPAVFDGITGKLLKEVTYAAFKTLLGLVKGDVGLGSVDNTSDADKPVSTATQSALDAKAALASPTFTGDPVAPTPSAGDNDTSIATTAFVNTQTRAARLGSHTTPDTTAGALAWTALLLEVFANTTTPYELPAAAGYDGRSVLFYNTGANVLTVDPNASEVIVRDGVVQTGGVTVTLSAGAGNFVVLTSDGVRWISLGYAGTLAAGA